MKEMPLKCLTCQLTFREKSFLCDHLYSHVKGKDLIHDICSEGLSEVYELNYFLHNRIQLKYSSQKEQFMCQVCKKRFAFKSYLDRHKRMFCKQKIYSCHICSESFLRDRDYYKHLDSHEQEKSDFIKSQHPPPKDPFVCQFCKEEFAFKTYFNQHIRYCGKKAPYICQICSGGFWNKPALYRHYLFCYKKETSSA